MCYALYGHKPVKIIKSYGGKEPEEYKPRDVSLKTTLLIILGYVLLIAIGAITIKLVWGCGFEGD